MYALLRAAIWPYFTYVQKFEHTVYKPKSKTYLVLTNHNTNWDFFYFGLSLKKQMYFVASEHIFRNGFSSKLIKLVAGPIPRRKGASGKETTELILKYLREGSNVCMMADGNRSYNGRTEFISPRTAQLVKDSGVGMITLCIHGGYFINPRWSSEVRKGPVWGGVVREFTAEELKKMSTDEIYDVICTDLSLNAYEDQEKAPVKYTCEHPAEHLETALFVCPGCKSFSTLKSENDRIRCTKCGMELLLNEYMYFEEPDGTRPELDTILKWDDWQLDYLRSVVSDIAPDEKIFSDTELKLTKVENGENHVLIHSGELTLYGDRMEICGEGRSISFDVRKIEKISVTLTSTMLFTYDGGYYELKSPKMYSARKYLITSRLLGGKKYI